MSSYVIGMKNKWLPGIPGLICNLFGSILGQFCIYSTFYISTTEFYMPICQAISSFVFDPFFSKPETLQYGI